MINFPSPVERAATRAGLLRKAAKACEVALAKEGVRAVVVGSLAYGDVRPTSDLDLLIVSHPGKKWSEVTRAATEAARPFGVQVDVIFADTLWPSIKRAMLKDARGARFSSTSKSSLRLSAAHGSHSTGKQWRRTSLG